MTPDERADFLGCFTFPEKSGLSGTTTNIADLTWTTELRVYDGTNEGRADIAAHASGRLSVIIENKIGADATDRQIALYESVLGQSEEETPLFLFLTHKTPPPPMFLEVSDSRIIFGYCFWVEIYRLLVRLAQNAESETVRSLSHEFSLFLKSLGMDSKIMNYSDMSALRLYFGAKHAIDTTLQTMADVSFTHLSKIVQKGPKTNQFELEGRKGNWWTCETAKAKFIVSTGLLFPDIADWNLPDGTNAPVAFVLFEDGKEPDAKRLDSYNWHKPNEDGERLVVIDLHDLLSVGDGAQARLKAWTNDRMREIVKAFG